MSVPDHHNPAVIDLRLSNLESALERLVTAVESIEKFIQVFANLEIKHEQTREAMARAFAQIERHEERIRSVEDAAPRITDLAGKMMSYKNDCNATCADHEQRIRSVEGTMPTVRLTSGWVIALAVGSVAAIGAALLSQVLK